MVKLRSAFLMLFFFVTAPAAAEAESTEVEIEQRLDLLTPYLGQQVPYRLEAIVSGDVRTIQAEELQIEGVWRETLPKDEQTAEYFPNGTVLYSLRESLYPIRSGEIEIPPRTVNIRTPASRVEGVGGFFGDFLVDRGGTFLPDDRQTRSIPGVVLHVRDLPNRPRDAHGYIPVGEISVRERKSLSSPASHPQLLYSIVVEGDAQLRPHQIKVSKIPNIELYEAKPQLELRVEQGRILQKKTFQFELTSKTESPPMLPSGYFYSFDPQKHSFVRHPFGDGLSPAQNMASSTAQSDVVEMHEREKPVIDPAITPSLFLADPVFFALVLLYFSLVIYFTFPVPTKKIERRKELQRRKRFLDALSKIAQDPPKSPYESQQREFELRTIVQRDPAQRFQTLQELSARFLVGRRQIQELSPVIERIERLQYSQCESEGGQP